MMALERRHFIKWLIHERTHHRSRLPERQGMVTPILQGRRLSPGSEAVAELEDNPWPPLASEMWAEMGTGGAPTVMDPQRSGQGRA